MSLPEPVDPSAALENDLLDDETNDTLDLDFSSLDGNVTNGNEVTEDDSSELNVLMARYKASLKSGEITQEQFDNVAERHAVLRENSETLCSLLNIPAVVSNIGLMLGCTFALAAPANPPFAIGLLSGLFYFTGPISELTTFPAQCREHRLQKAAKLKLENGSNNEDPESNFSNDHSCVGKLMPVRWDWVSTPLFFMASLSYIVSAFLWQYAPVRNVPNATINATQTEEYYPYGEMDGWAVLGSLVFLISSVTNFFGRLTYRKSIHGTAFDTRINPFVWLCGGRHFNQIDWGYHGDILFIFGSVMELVDSLTLYSNSVTIVLGPLLWWVDSALYFIEYAIYTDTEMSKPLCFHKTLDETAHVRGCCQAELKDYHKMHTDVFRHEAVWRRGALRNLDRRKRVVESYIAGIDWEG